jgi:hypothetical protein
MAYVSPFWEIDAHGRVEPLSSPIELDMGEMTLSVFCPASSAIVTKLDDVRQQYLKTVEKNTEYIVRQRASVDSAALSTAENPIGAVSEAADLFCFGEFDTG